jgi:hypothetical protein
MKQNLSRLLLPPVAVAVLYVLSIGPTARMVFNADGFAGLTTWQTFYRPLARLSARANWIADGLNWYIRLWDPNPVLPRIPGLDPMIPDLPLPAPNMPPGRSP